MKFSHFGELFFAARMVRIFYSQKTLAALRLRKIKRFFRREGVADVEKSCRGGGKPGSHADLLPHESAQYPPNEASALPPHELASDQFDFIKDMI